MNVLVVGATGGSGRAAVRSLLAAGHRVTAFARGARSLEGMSADLRCVVGDAMDASQLRDAMPGHDAVVVTLGIAENPIRVRWSGAKSTASNVRSAGTANIVDAMRDKGVRRLVVQTSYGVGETRDRLPALYRMMFSLLLKPQIADTEVQEQVVRRSGLDWTLAQPVNLTDNDAQTSPFASTTGDTRGMKVTRAQVGRYLAEAVSRPEHVGRTVALSGGGAA